MRLEVEVVLSIVRPLQVGAMPEVGGRQQLVQQEQSQADVLEESFMPTIQRAKFIQKTEQRRIGEQQDGLLIYTASGTTGDIS